MFKNVLISVGLKCHFLGRSLDFIMSISIIPIEREHPKDQQLSINTLFKVDVLLKIMNVLDNQNNIVIIIIIYISIVFIFR